MALLGSTNFGYGGPGNSQGHVTPLISQTYVQGVVDTANMPYGELFYLQLNKNSSQPMFTGRVRAEHSFWLQDRYQYQYSKLSQQSTNYFYGYFDPKAKKGMEL